MTRILTYSDIYPAAWQSLVAQSPYATWFQTPEAYAFYASLPDEMTPFAVGVDEDGQLMGVVVGYTTRETNPIKQLFTCRSIVIGGPLLDERISDNAVTALLCAVKRVTRSSIYVETRNFHDYSRWRHVFEQCGFAYQAHLNFHVDTSSVEVVDKNLGKSRKRDIRTTIRDGVTPVLNPTIEQVREYYAILKDLYTTKVKTPLFSWHFFEQLYHTAHGRFILTEYKGKIIGGTVCVVLPNRAVYEWFVCGIDGVYEHIFPSSYATYLGIRYAAENGCQIFDMMGAGKPDEAYGVRDFKARFGGEQVEHGRYLCICKPLLYWIGKLGVKLLKKR
ncbi:MAG: peptidoglycan bridge formation glycyltransferase FemA/FemB family protein [Paludibacteraceae bacterium]|nr:peptidoglycan bridge formation glycyltransferase FemA/FemB family protein [Paludibacteraceae bacterium]